MFRHAFQEKITHLLRYDTKFNNIIECILYLFVEYYKKGDTFKVSPFLYIALFI